MTTAHVDIELREKLERFKQAMLSTVPGITEEGAEKAAKAWEKSYYTKQAKQLAGLVGDHKKAGDDVGKTWTELGKKIAEMAGGPFADLGDAVFELVPKASAATMALGGIAAGAVGIAATGAAMYGLAEAAEAAEDRLTEAGMAALIPEESKAALDAYAESMEGLRTQVDLLLVQIGTPAAEAVTGWTAVLTGAAADLRELAGASDETGEDVETFSDRVINAFPPLVGMKGAVFAATWALSGFVTEAAEANKAAEDIADSAWLAENAYAALGMAVDDEQILGDRKKRLQEEAREEEKAAKEAERRAKDAAREDMRIAAEERARLIHENQEVLDIEDAQRTKAREKLKAHNDAMVAGTLNAWVLTADAAGKSLDEMVAALDVAMAGLEVGLEGHRAMVQANLQGVSNVANAVQMLADFQVEKGGEAAKAAFRVSQAAALADIAVYTASAVMEAAPNPVLIAGTLALGAAQAGIVAATPPPEFAGGGVVPPEVLAMKSASPDHGLIGASPGEGVVNHRGMDVLGEDGLNEVNRGRAPMGPIVVQQVYGHRVFDSFIADNLKRGGPLAKALAGQRKPGRPRRRG